MSGTGGNYSAEPIFCYLIHRTEIIGREKLPRFDEVQNFYAVTDWEDVPQFLFFSHRYFLYHVDDALHTKFKVIESILIQMKHINYVWIDFSCVSFDPDSKGTILMNIEMLISKAVRFILIPFKSFSPSKPPIFNMLDYSTRAWCALEFSIALARHPSKVRIAQICSEKTASTKVYTVKFISLPTHDKALGVQHIVDGMKNLRNMVEGNKVHTFLATFSSAVQADRQMVWGFLCQRHQEIFKLAGVRRNSDFFVRTKYASFSTQVSERGAFLYDQLQVNKFQEDSGCMFFCIKMPWQNQPMNEIFDQDKRNHTRLLTAHSS